MRLRHDSIEQKRVYFDVTNAAYFRQNPEKKAEYAKKFDKIIKFYSDELLVLNNNMIRFIKATTENIMDYSSDGDCSTPPIVYYNNHKKITFHKYQWKIIEEEAKNIYH